MPQLIALTSLYAQCEQGGYLLLPIFAKMAIFGIFRDFREFPDPPQIFGIFAQNPGFLPKIPDFWRFFAKIGDFWDFLGILAKIGTPPRGVVVGAVFSKNRTLWHERKSIFRVIGFFYKKRHRIE